MRNNFIKNWDGISAFVFNEPVGDLAIEGLGARIKKLFVLLVFIYNLKEAVIGAVNSKKYLPFPIQNKFLQVKRNRFRYAEVLSILRNRNFQFFAGSEKMVDRSEERRVGNGGR